LQAGTVAQIERLDHILQRVQMESARAGYEPKPFMSGAIQQQRLDGITGASRQNVLSTGAAWTLLTGTRLKAQLNHTSGSSADVIGTTRQANWVFELVQPLLRGAGASARYPLKLAELSERMGELARNQSLDGVYIAVSLAFFDAVTGQRQVVLSQRALERVLKSKGVNHALLEAGRMATLELLQSDADVAQAEFDLARARTDALTKTNALLQLLGPEWSARHPQDVVLPETLPGLSANVSPQAYEQAVAQAQNTRADLLLAKDAVEMGLIGLAQAENDALPVLDMTVSRSALRSSTVGTAGGSSGIMLNLEVPLDRSLLRQQHTQAQVNFQRAELYFQDALRQVRSDVMTALREFESSKAQLELATKNVEINRRKLQAEEERFRVGKISNFQLSAALNDIRVAEENQIQAQLFMQRAAIESDRATGALSARRTSVMQAP
jgi:outer membrane protein TolC